MRPILEITLNNIYTQSILLAENHMWNCRLFKKLAGDINDSNAFERENDLNNVGHIYVKSRDLDGCLQIHGVTDISSRTGTLTSMTHLQECVVHREML